MRLLRKPSPKRPRARRSLCCVAPFSQYALSHVAVLVEPDLVNITPYYEPSAAAVWFQVSDFSMPWVCLG